MSELELVSRKVLTPSKNLPTSFIMHHYVYYSYEEWGRGYIGVRSCKCFPEEDSLYLGSFKDKTFLPSCKIILGLFNTRSEAVEAEIALHDFFEVHVNPHFANQAKQTSTGYDRKGVVPAEEIKQKYREAYHKFREEQPELYQKRKELALEGIRRYMREEPEKFCESMRARGRAGGASLAEKRLKDPDYDRKLRQAVSDSMEIRFTADYQQMLIEKARQSKSIPVVVTYRDGSQEEFESFIQCRKHLGISAHILHKKLKRLPTRKFKEIAIDYKRPPENDLNLCE